MTEFDCLEVTPCGWQAVEIQLLSNVLERIASWTNTDTPSAAPFSHWVVWPLTVSAAPLTPQWCGPWLSVQPPWPLSGVALDCQCSPLDPSVVWPLTVSAAPLNPVMKPPWLLSGVALVCQCSPSQLDFVCAAASGPRHDGTGVQEHHATGAHQLHAELPAGRCHCVWPWARIRS